LSSNGYRLFNAQVNGITQTNVSEIVLKLDFVSSSIPIQTLLPTIDSFQGNFTIDSQDSIYNASKYWEIVDVNERSVVMKLNAMDIQMDPGGEIPFFLNLTWQSSLRNVYP
jgi:hypothetical protein